MKKSEIYVVAMRCVIESELRSDTILEVIERLMADKQLAEWSEKKNEEDKGNVQ